jgi:predicted HTH transcriptional regulator
MKIAQLQKLINQGENQQIDFKVTVAKNRKIAKTLVAFANTRGGKLLVGVRDDRQMIGVDPEEEKFSIDHAARFFCKPEVTVHFEEVEDKYGKVILVVSVPESEQKPHFARDTHGEWQPFVRVNDQCLLAGKAALRAMQQSRKILVALNQKERSLLSYLAQHQRITVKQYAHLVNISERRARRSLIDLVQAGTLYQMDFEKEDFFTLA